VCFQCAMSVCCMFGSLWFCVVWCVVDGVLWMVCSIIVFLVCGCVISAMYVVHVPLVVVFLLWGVGF